MGVGTESERLPNRIRYCAGILQDIVIPKPQNSESRFLQERCPGEVSRRRISMLAAVHLHHELLFEAYEIQHVALEGMLAAELPSSRLSAAQQVPKLPLGVGRIAAEGPRNAAFLDESAGLAFH
jgi:hypothetical protein